MLPRDSQRSSPTGADSRRCLAPRDTAHTWPTLFFSAGNVRRRGRKILRTSAVRRHVSGHACLGGAATDPVAPGPWSLLNAWRPKPQCQCAAAGRRRRKIDQSDEPTAAPRECRMRLDGAPDQPVAVWPRRVSVLHQSNPRARSVVAGAERGKTATFPGSPTAPRGAHASPSDGAACRTALCLGSWQVARGTKPWARSAAVVSLARKNRKFRRVVAGATRRPRVHRCRWCSAGDSVSRASAARAPTEIADARLAEVERRLGTFA